MIGFLNSSSGVRVVSQGVQDFTMETRKCQPESSSEWQPFGVQLPWFCPTRNSTFPTWSAFSRIVRVHEVLYTISVTLW